MTNALTSYLNTAFHANAFNGFDPSEFDVDAYIMTPAFVVFDDKDLFDLTGDRELSVDILEDIVTEAWDDEPVGEEWDGFNSDAEADADVLASAGWGTDEDYGYYGEE